MPRITEVSGWVPNSSVWRTLRALGLAAGLAACQASPPAATQAPTPSAAPPTESLATAAPATAPPAETATPGAGEAARIQATIPGAFTFPVLAAGSVWAPDFEKGIVVRVDTETNEVVAEIPVGEEPHGLVARDSEVYVAATDDEGAAVFRIDPATNQVAERFDLRAAGWGLSVSGDTLWVSAFERGGVHRIDLETGDVSELRRLQRGVGIDSAEDEVWVALAGLGWVARFDTTTEEYSLIETGTRTTAMLELTDEEVWVTTLDGEQVLIISRETHEVVDRIPMQFTLGVLEHEGLIWVTDGVAEDGGGVDRVVAVDPATRETVRVINLPGKGVDRGMEADGDDLWLATGEGLVRLDISQD